MSRTRKLLAAVLVLALLTLVGGELALRASMHPPDAGWPHVWEPLTRTVYQVAEPIPGLGATEAVVTTSSIGLRADELDPDADTLRILTLGGSVTECLLLDDAATWPHLLQQELRAAGRSAWVGNGGRSGQATVDYTLHLLELGPRLAPDLVVVMPGANDLQAAMEDRYFPVDLRDPGQRQRMADRAYPAERDDRVAELRLSHLRFLVLRRSKTMEVGGFYKAMKERRAVAPKVATIPELRTLMSLYRANLQELVRVASAQGTPVLLLTHPHLWRADLSPDEAAATWGGYSCMNCSDPVYYADAAIADALGQLNRATLQVCEDGDARCFDLDARVPRTLESFYDGAHMTADGARTAARELARHLLETDLLP